MSTVIEKRRLLESERLFNRRMAKKYGLDFEHRCCFHHQIAHIGKGTRDDWSDQEVEVEMQSGRKALYLLTKHDNNYGGTGQRIWRYEFIKYLT